MTVLMIRMLGISLIISGIIGVNRGEKEDGTRAFPIWSMAILILAGIYLGFFKFDFGTIHADTLQFIGDNIEIESSKNNTEDNNIEWFTSDKASYIEPTEESSLDTDNIEETIKIGDKPYKIPNIPVSNREEDFYSDEYYATYLLDNADLTYLSINTGSNMLGNESFMMKAYMGGDSVGDDGKIYKDGELVKINDVSAYIWSGVKDDIFKVLLCCNLTGNEGIEVELSEYDNSNIKKCEDDAIYYLTEFLNVNEINHNNDINYTYDGGLDFNIENTEIKSDIEDAGTSYVKKEPYKIDNTSDYLIVDDEKVYLPVNKADIDHSYEIKDYNGIKYKFNDNVYNNNNLILEYWETDIEIGDIKAIDDLEAWNQQIGNSLHLSDTFKNSNGNTCYIQSFETSDGNFVRILQPYKDCKHYIGVMLTDLGNDFNNVDDLEHIIFDYKIP